MPATKRPPTTTEKGLGWRHRQEVDRLRRQHHDGSPCDWCGRPRWLDRTRNFDYDPERGPASGQLHGDHSTITRSEAVRQGIPIPPPDRLLHGTCNIQRGTGTNDHLAANNTNTSTGTGTGTGSLHLGWPASW